MRIQIQIKVNDTCRVQVKFRVSTSEETSLADKTKLFKTPRLTINIS